MTIILPHRNSSGCVKNAVYMPHGRLLFALSHALSFHSINVSNKVYLSTKKPIYKNNVNYTVVSHPICFNQVTL